MVQKSDTTRKHWSTHPHSPRGVNTNMDPQNSDSTSEMRFLKVGLGPKELKCSKSTFLSKKIQEKKWKTERNLAEHPKIFQIEYFQKKNSTSKSTKKKCKKLQKM